MSTMAALTQHGRTFLLLNADAEVDSGDMARIDRGADGLVHIAGRNGPSSAVRGGVYRTGLALLLSPVDADVPFPAHTLGDCRDVCSALARIEVEVARDPALTGGQILLGDGDCIALVRYGAGRAECETREAGLLVCATSAERDGGENGQPDDGLRGDFMREFTEELYAWLPTLDDDDVVERCRGALRKEPLYTAHTRYSLIVDVRARRIECAARAARWKML